MTQSHPVSGTTSTPKTYKSSGGEIVESEMGMIPKGWRVGKLDELVEIIDGDRGTNYPSHQDFSQSGYCLFLNAGNVSKVGFNFSTNNFISKEKDKILRKGKLSRYDMYLQQEGQSEISVIWENLYHLIIFE